MNHHLNGDHVAHFAALEDIFSHLSFFFLSSQQSPTTAARYVQLLRALSSRALAAADALSPTPVQTPAPSDEQATPTPPPRPRPKVYQLACHSFMAKYGIQKHANAAAARYRSIKGRPLTKKSPMQLYEFLMAPRKRQHSEEEDNAFHRLLCGYWAMDQNEWVCFFSFFYIACIHSIHRMQHLST
jgi:hypothetical protein